MVAVRVSIGQCPGINDVDQIENSMHEFPLEARYEVHIAHVGMMNPVTSFADIESTIRESLAPINSAINDESPVAVSLRLSQAALSDEALSAESLQTLLAANNLELWGISAVSISGGTKEQVHQPDWRAEERLGFMFPATNLAATFATPEQEIGITTNALSHRRWVDVDMPGNWAALTLNVIRMVQHLAGIRDRTGITLHMDLEPEPGSVLRDTADVVTFFTKWLLPRGGAMLSDRMSLGEGSASEIILRHVRVALDTAHAAVVWDDASSSLDAFAEVGIRIGRLQVSSALEVDVPSDVESQKVLAEHLSQFSSPTLLQQVVAQKHGEIVQRYDDLPDAIAAMSESADQTWRIHTHAPLLADRYGGFTSTRQEAATWLREISARGIDIGMIELRSANWDVVPHDDRASLEAMIMEEADWVREQIALA